MSEDSNFNKNKPQMNTDERRCGIDLCGSLGKGMLAKEKIETLGNAYGLTPLSFGVNFRKNTEMPSNSSGLSPFCPSGEIYSIKKKSLSLVEDFSTKDGLETCENSSGLIPLNFNIKPEMKVPRITPLGGVSTYAPQGIRVRGVENPQGFGIDERRCSCIEIEKNELAEKELNISVRSESLRFRGKFPEVGVI